MMLLSRISHQRRSCQGRSGGIGYWLWVVGYRGGLRMPVALREGVRPADDVGSLVREEERKKGWAGGSGFRLWVVGYRGPAFAWGEAVRERGRAGRVMCES